MQIRCPKCGFVREVADKDIPEQAQMATCPKCGYKFRFREAPHLLADREKGRGPEPSPKGDDAPGAKDPRQPNRPASKRPDSRFRDSKTGPDPDRRSSMAVPWEALEEFGFFTGLRLTITRVLISPREFFSRLPVDTGLSMPLVFYLLLAEVQALAQFFWQLAGITPHMAQGPQLGLVGLGSALILIIYPIFLTCILFLVTGINHVCLLALRTGKNGFQGTFRAVAYGSAPFILAVIPVFGPMLGGVWGMVCTIIGLSCVHETSILRVFLAMFLPVILLITLSALFLTVQTIV